MRPGHKVAFSSLVERSEQGLERRQIFRYLLLQLFLTGLVEALGADVKAHIELVIPVQRAMLRPPRMCSSAGKNPRQTLHNCVGDEMIGCRSLRRLLLIRSRKDDDVFFMGVCPPAIVVHEGLTVLLIRHPLVDDAEQEVDTEFLTLVVKATCCNIGIELQLVSLRTLP